MNRLILPVLLLSLISCDDKYQAKDYELIIRYQLNDLEFDYKLPKKKLPLEIHQFQPLDLGVKAG